MLVAITATVMQRVAMDDTRCRRGRGDGLAPPDVVWTAGVRRMGFRKRGRAMADGAGCGRAEEAC
jgi:hypothetical protein